MQLSTIGQVPYKTVQDLIGSVSYTSSGSFQTQGKDHDIPEGSNFKVIPNL